VRPQSRRSAGPRRDVGQPNVRRQATMDCWPRGRDRTARAILVRRRSALPPARLFDKPQRGRGFVLPELPHLTLGSAGYVKYRFGDGPVRPFVIGGGAFERAGISGSAGCTGDAMLCGTSAGTHELKSSELGGGILSDVGVEFRRGALKIAPEFRYTRWQR